MLSLIGADLLQDMYFVINSTTTEVKTFTKSSAIELMRKRVKIENLTIEKGNLKGSRGDLKRYPVDCQVPVILFRLEDDTGNLRGYRIFDVSRTIRDFSLEDAVNIGLSYGFANAKVVTKKNGSFVVSLGESFPTQVVRAERYDLNRVIIEITKKGSKVSGMVTLEDRAGKLSRQKVILSPSESTVGYILGRVFNKYLRGCLYELIDGKRQPAFKERPDGVFIGKTANYREGLSVSEYIKVCNYLGMTFERVVEKTNFSVYQIRI